MLLGPSRPVARDTSNHADGSSISKRMPTLKYYVSEGSPKIYSVHKPVTTIGKAPGNDIVINGDKTLPNHVQLSFDGRDFIVEELQRAGALTINGKKKRRARLVHGDRLDIGGSEVSFSIFAEQMKKRRDREPSQEGTTGFETQATGLGAHEVG